MAEFVPMQITSTRSRADGGTEQPLQILGASLYDRSAEVVRGAEGFSCAPYHEKLPG